MPKVVRIETEHLLLREQLDTDVEAWATLSADADFRRYIPVRKSDDAPETRAARSLEALMTRWATEPLARAGWVIARRADGQMVGTCGVDEGEAPTDGEIEYFLGKPFWGQGYGKEAADAVARFVVEHMAYERLVAYVVPGNVGSIRIAESLGLEFEAIVDYTQFFPDPSIVELADPMTRRYAARRSDVTLGAGAYRTL